MPATVRLDDIVDGFEMQTEEFLSFVNLDTGQVATVQRQTLGRAEEMDEEEAASILKDKRDPEFELANRIVSSDRWERLPTKYDVNDWEIMADFCNSVSSDETREVLLDAIHGPGAFRCFRSAIARYGLRQSWFDFRNKALRDIAKEWCEEKNIAWE